MTRPFTSLAHFALQYNTIINNVLIIIITIIIIQHGGHTPADHIVYSGHL